jgi:ABC-type thiamin/hydroxymethylpyrimidine transport system permease subunit
LKDSIDAFVDCTFQLNNVCYDSIDDKVFNDTNENGLTFGVQILHLVLTDIRKVGAPIEAVDIRAAYEQICNLQFGMLTIIITILQRYFYRIHQCLYL